MNIGELKRELTKLGLSTSTPGLVGDERFEELRDRLERVLATSRAAPQESHTHVTVESSGTPVELSELTPSQLTIGELRTRLSSLGISTSTPGLTGEQRWEELKSRLITAICGHSEGTSSPRPPSSSSKHPQVEAATKSTNPPIRISPPRRRPPPTLPPSPEEIPPSSPPSAIPSIISIPQQQIAQLKRDLKSIQNRRAVWIASKLDHESSEQDSSLRQLEMKCHTLTRDILRLSDLQKFTPEKFDPKYDLNHELLEELDVHLNTPTLAAAILRLEETRAGLKESIRVRQMSLRKLGEAHPQFGKSAEDAIQKQLSDAISMNSRRPNLITKPQVLPDLATENGEITLTPTKLSPMISLTVQRDSPSTLKLDLGASRSPSTHSPIQASPKSDYDNMSLPHLTGQSPKRSSPMKPTSPVVASRVIIDDKEVEEFLSSTFLHPQKNTSSVVSAPPATLSSTMSAFPSPSKPDSDLQADSSQSPEIAILLTKSKHMEEQGDIPAAEMLLERALELDPVDITTLQTFAVFLHKKRGELARAEAFFNRALQIASPQLYQQICIDRIFHQSPSITDVSPPETTATNMTVLSTDRVPVAQLVHLFVQFSAFLSKAKGDLELATVILKKAVELAPKSAYATASLAHFLAHNDLDNENYYTSHSVDDLFRYALKLEPRNSLFQMWYGKYLKKQNRLGAAEVMYRAAVDSARYDRKNEATVICNYATFLFKYQKKEAEAIALFEDAIQRMSDHPGLRKNYTKLMRSRRKDMKDENNEIRPFTASRSKTHTPSVITQMPPEIESGTTEERAAFILAHFQSEDTADSKHQTE